MNSSYKGTVLVLFVCLVKEVNKLLFSPPKHNMELEAVTKIGAMFVPDIKVENEWDISDCENEKKWNADPLTEETDVNEVYMSLIKEEEVKIESSESANDQLTTKQENECLTGSNKEDVSSLSSDDSSRTRSSIIPTVQNSQHDQFQLPHSHNTNQFSETRSQHSNDECSESEWPYKCNVSSESLEDKSILTSHSPTHPEGKPFTCDICTKSFDNRRNLKSHLSVHSSAKTIPCNICNKLFTHSRYVKRHMRTHKNVRQHECNICVKSFTDKGDLKKHIRTHTNERPYTCSVCTKSFVQGIHLRKHMRIHTNERPYTCKTCDKSFKESGQLKTHERCHSNDRPYSCNICEKSFSRSSDVSRHQRSHTNERPYACNICKKSFLQTAHLSKHKLTHHR